jgi:hypothetical protein
MLASPSRELDRELYAVTLDILSIALQMYKKEPTDDLKTYIENYTTYADELKLRIDTHDYQKEDEAYARVTETLDKSRLWLSPPPHA